MPDTQVAGPTLGDYTAATLERWGADPADIAEMVAYTLAEPTWVEVYAGLMPLDHRARAEARRIANAVELGLAPITADGGRSWRLPEVAS